MKQIYLCEDSVDGMLSALYDAWKECRNGEAEIEPEGQVQCQLFSSYRHVETDRRKAGKVTDMLRKNLGGSACQDIFYALLSDYADRGTAVFRVMQSARYISNSKNVMQNLGNPDVARVFFLSRKVANEVHHYIEFVRFRELENGVLFSQISPKFPILECLAGHFSDRFPRENWMICDKIRSVFLIHRSGEECRIVRGQELNQEMAERVSVSQVTFENLWKVFFSSVTIAERENPECQRNHLPYRFRDEMPEFGGIYCN